MRPSLPSEYAQVLNLRALLSAVLCASMVSLGWGASADDHYFEISTIKNEDRSAAADLADFNGDGRVDVLVVALRGLPRLKNASRVSICKTKTVPSPRIPPMCGPFQNGLRSMT